MAKSKGWRAGGSVAPPERLPARGEPPAPLLITAEVAAQLVGKSARTWRSWHAQGWVPSAVRVGRSIYWRRAELQAWISAGCPQRSQWEQIWRSEQRT